MATAPKMGEAKGTVTGAAGGGTAEGGNSALERCNETLGTMAMHEDATAPWYVQLRQYQLGSTLPVLRLMVQQSNCFVIVERGAAMQNMMRERTLESDRNLGACSRCGWTTTGRSTQRDAPALRDAQSHRLTCRRYSA